MSPTERLLLSEVHESQKRIEMAMFGDPEAKIDGLVHKVERHEKKVNRHEKLIWVVSGFVAAWEIIKEKFI